MWVFQESRGQRSAPDDNILIYLLFAFTLSGLFAVVVFVLPHVFLFNFYWHFVKLFPGGHLILLVI